VTKNSVETLDAQSEQKPHDAVAVQPGGSMIVLFATDGSSDSHYAIREAARLLSLQNAQNFTIAVSPPPPIDMAFGPGGAQLASFASQTMLSENIDRATAEHSRLAQNVFTELGLTATALERTGDPADEILHAAHEVGADVIVLGSHGHGAIERLLLGSVSDKVAHGASRAVMIIRPAPGNA
jgi:nucleotide-binding universal stress UspA family protein